MVYVMNLKMDFGLPAPYYYDIVREGYEDCGLNPAVLEQALRESTVQFYGSHWWKALPNLADEPEEVEADEAELDETDPFYFSEGMHL